MRCEGGDMKVSDLEELASLVAGCEGDGALCAFPSPPLFPEGQRTYMVQHLADVVFPGEDTSRAKFYRSGGGWRLELCPSGKSYTWLDQTFGLDPSDQTRRSDGAFLVDDLALLGVCDLLQIVS